MTRQYLREPILCMMLLAPTALGQSRDPFQFARTIFTFTPYPSGSQHIAAGNIAGSDSQGELTVVTSPPAPMNGFVPHFEFWDDQHLLASTVAGPLPGFGGSSIMLLAWFTAPTDGPAAVCGYFGNPFNPLGVAEGWFVLRNGRLVARSRQPLVAPAHAGWSYYGGVTIGKMTSKTPEQLFIECSIRNTTTGQTRFGILQVNQDSQGNIVDEFYVLEYGQSLPGVPGVQLVGSPYFSAAPNGKVIAYVHTNQPGGMLWYDGQVVLALNDPSNIPGRTIEDIWSPDVNSRGDWAATVELNGNEFAVVKNGVVQWRGDQPPFDTGGYRISHIERLSIAEDGRVFVIAQTDHPVIHYSRWLLVDGKPVYTPWRDQVNDSPVAGPNVGAIQWTDPEGAFATFLSGLVGSGVGGTFIVPLVRSSVICDGPQRANGDDPTIEYLGSTRTIAAERYLIARGLPPNGTVVWLRSHVLATIPLPGAGQGTLCVGSPTVRLAGTTNGNGDILAPASYSGTPGRTYYQVWYRDIDPISGAPTSRVSDAIVVDLQ